MSYERLVELQRWPGIGFGFSVIGGSDTHIPPMICALVRDSPALLSKKVFVGDVLYKVNGHVVSNLETKQVVDLIRNCKQSIVLSLREDRLAKLKARPFLAEDSLIEPPRAAKSPTEKVSDASFLAFPVNSSSCRNLEKSYSHDHCDNKNSVNFPQYSQSIPIPNNESKKAHVRTVGVPSNYHYEGDGHFIYKQSGKYPNELNQSYSDQGLGSDQMDGKHKYYLKKPKSPRSYATASSNDRPVMATAHLYNVEDLPPSPRSFVNTEAPTYKSLANRHKYNSEDYSTHLFSGHDNNTQSENNSRSPGIYTEDLNYVHSTSRNLLHATLSHTKSAPPYKLENQFDFNDGTCVSYLREQSIEYPSKNRPYSNPDVEKTYTERLKDPPTFNDLKIQSCRRDFHAHSNYSSPNVFEESERTYSVHKALTLTPVSHSVHSLAKPNFYEDQELSFNDSSHLLPLSMHTPNSTCVAPSMMSSPVSSTTSNMSQNVCPADIASRLFTLNGYKDSDVAPLLGKNTEFSQSVCREYLRFFSFEGLNLDEAIRVFLKKFPLTGETQERERILIHFSKRYQECNRGNNMSEDAVHTLVCAIMLLNTDLHGQSITNKMSLNDFITNLSGLCDGGDFPKEHLKTLYNAIRQKEIVFASVNIDNSPKPRRKNSAPGNPFIELKTDSGDTVLCEGLIYRKSVMDPGGRRTPAIRRNWRPCYCVLKGLIVLSYKPESINSHEPQAIGIHHCLAGYAKDYKKRAYVFKLITSDWSVYYIQAKNQDEVRSWMDSLNVSAAMMSSPPLPAPVGSSMRFQRPVMPVSKTRLSLEEQLAHHVEKVKTIELDLASHTEYTPDHQNKHYQDWENKLDYLEFELKRFKAYASVLTSKRLESIRKKILNSQSTAPSPSKTNALSEKSRSSSMHSLIAPPPVSPLTRKRMVEENRNSYFVGPVSP